MVKVIQSCSSPFHGELKAFLILLARHLHCYPARNAMAPSKPQHGSVDVSSRREESTRRETSSEIIWFHSNPYSPLLLGTSLGLYAQKLYPMFAYPVCACSLLPSATGLLVRLPLPQGGRMMMEQASVAAHANPGRNEHQPRANQEHL